jgi:3-hydroxymyristoyl/3-hydroxydecanoyl-(acyl carrier protein) dehydratase
MMMTDGVLFDAETITSILPHRNPFLFVDRIIKIIKDQRIVAEKDLSYDDYFFAGHFPGNPIMPGVLVSEALAQTSGLLLGLSSGKESQTVDHKMRSFFLANVNIKFFNPAKPEETLRLEAKLKKKYGKFFLFEVAADVVNRRIAKGTLTLANENA